MTFTQKAGSLLAVSLVLFGCSTPKNIAYMQDSYNDAIVETIKANPIRLKPMDKISIVVNSRDPQIATMFNLIYTSVHLGAGTSLNGGFGNGGQMVLPYTVDKDGEIDFPVLGKVKVAGLTRAETAEHIKNLLIASNQIKDPVVTVDFMNLGFSILGEVSRPGRYRIDRDAFTILDAISQAGDLTINGQRENVTLIRNYGTAQEIFYKMNLTDTEDIFSSPAYYLEQGDIVYVTPNPKRRRESTVSANSAFTPSFWISLASTATSITSAILVIVRTSK